MKDLEIRGAGNLLGGEQSGHIEGVGFDLYVRLVGEAVAEFKGERPRRGGRRRQDRPAGRRPPPVRLHRRRAPAPGGLPQARRGPRRRGAGRGGGRDDRSVRQAAGRGGQPDRGRPIPAAGSRVRAERRLAAGPAHPVRPGDLPDSKQLRLKRLYPESVYKQATDQVSLPRPNDRKVGGEPLRDAAMLQWSPSCWPRCSATRRRCPGAEVDRAGRGGTVPGCAEVIVGVREWPRIMCTTVKGIDRV